jgi:chromosome segregation ATPase
VLRELAAVKQEYHDFRQKNLNAEQQITDLKKEMRFYYNEGESNKTNAASSQKEVSEMQNQNEKLAQQLKEKQHELAHATKHSHLYYEEIAKLERSLEAEIIRNESLLERMSQIQFDAAQTIDGPMKRLELELDITTKKLTAETNALSLANKKLEGIENEMITRVQTRDQLIITERMYKTEAQRELKVNIEAAEKACRA